MISTRFFFLHLVLQSPDILVVVSGSLTIIFLDVAQQEDVRFTVFWCEKEDFRVIINHISIIFLI